MKEIVFASCVITASAAVFGLTLSFPPELAVEGGIGPGFFPQAIAVVLVMLGLVLLVGALKRRGGANAEQADPGSFRAVVTAFLIILGYAVAIYVVGFPIGTLAFLLTLISYYLSPLAWKRFLTVALPTAAAITAVSYALFGIALRIPLPRGVFF